MALDRDLLFELIVAELSIPVKYDLGNKRFLTDQKRQGRTSCPRFRLDLHFFKVSGFVEDLDLASDIFRGVGIAGFQCQSTDNRRQLNPFISSNLDRRHFYSGWLRSDRKHRQQTADQCDEYHDDKPAWPRPTADSPHWICIP